MKRAVAISFNWITKQCLPTVWDGDGCAQRARDWIAPGSFIWREYPVSEGWTHFVHFSCLAAREAQREPKFLQVA